MCYKYVCVVVLAIFYSLPGKAQDASQISNYKKQLQTVQSDTERVHILSMLCFSYSIINSDTALMYGAEGMKLARTLKPEQWVAHVSNSLGWTYLKRSEFDSAEKYFLSSLKIWESTGDKKDKKRVFSNLGVLYMEMVDYTKSMQYLSQAIELDGVTKDTTGKGIDLYNMGRLYNLQGNYLEARKYFQLAFDTHKLLGSGIYTAEALLSIGNTYQSAGDDDQALAYYAKCFPIFQKLKDRSRTGLTYENMAGSFMNKKQFDKSIQYYLLAIHEYQFTGNKTDMFYGNMGLADTYIKTKKYVLAEKALKEAMQFAIDLKDKNLQYLAATNMSDMYKIMGDYTKAYSFLYDARIIKDSLFTKDKQQELLKLQTKFETERKDKENKLLKAQNDIANATLQRNRIFLIVASFGILLLVGLLYMIYKNKEAKAKHIKELELLNQQLQDQQKEINDINTTLQLKALRSQMNPHFIFNCMSSIQECMLTGRTDDALSYLTKLSKLLRMVLNHADDENILLSKELEILNLYLQLEKIRLKDSFDYIINMEEDLIPEEIMVPTLILQPFAENAIWHGLLSKEQNRQLFVKGTIQDEILCLIVEDNGIGREKALLQKSLKKSHDSKGLSLITKRLDILKKQYLRNNVGFTFHDLADSDNQVSGTRVTIILPIIPA